jgi:integrase
VRAGRLQGEPASADLSSGQDTHGHGEKVGEVAHRRGRAADGLGMRTRDFAECYLTDVSARKHAPRTHESYRYYARLIGGLDELPIADLTAEDVYQLHLRVTADHGPIVANRVLSFVSQLHKHATIRGLRSGENPCAAIPRNGENKRTEFLTQRERVAFIRAARMCALSGEVAIPAAGALLLMILAGRRSSEARLLLWTEVELFDEGGLIRLATREVRGASKSDDHRALPLSSSAAAVIRTMPRWRPHVFASRRTGKPYTDLRKPLRRITARAGLRTITPHVLRHSYGTACAESGLTPDEIAACLGHVGRDSARRYVHLGGRGALQAAMKAAKAAGGGAL